MQSTLQRRSTTEEIIMSNGILMTQSHHSADTETASTRFNIVDSEQTGTDCERVVNRNPAMAFTATQAREATNASGDGIRRVARRMAERYCECVVMPEIRTVACAGIESTVSIIRPLEDFVTCVWESAPADGRWPQWAEDKVQWGTEALDSDGSPKPGNAPEQPWNRAGNPYRMAMHQLTRMLEEAGYRAHACMEVRSTPAYGGGNGTYYAVRVTVSW